MSETTRSRSESDQSPVVKAVFRLGENVGTAPNPTGVCPLVVPKLQNSAFLLRIVTIAGAEGENSTPLCFTRFFAHSSNMLTK